MLPAPSVVVVQDSAQATAFLARTSGLDNTHVYAYKNLINGLVQDGVWPLLDTLWVPATQDQTTANLNLVSSLYTMVNHAAGWTADTGYKSSAVANYVDCVYNPGTNGVNYTATTGHIMGWSVFTSSSTDVNAMITQRSWTAISANIYPRFTDSKVYGRVNDNGSGVANTDRQGCYVATRTSSSALTIYKNATSMLASTVGSSSVFSGALQLLNFNSSTGNITDTVAAAAMGGNVNSVQAAYYNRLRTYMTAVGVP